MQGLEAYLIVRREQHPDYPITHAPMPIFRALGLGVLILVLGWLVPEVLLELRATAVAFLTGARVSAEVATQIAGSAGAAPASIPLSALPFAPTYNP